MMKRNHKTGFTLIAVIVCLILSMMITVSAAPSISDLHGNEEETIVQPVSGDDSNTGEILSGEDIYTNEAIPEQYMIKDQNGTLKATPISDTIDLAAGTISETDQNGNPIPDDITTVEGIVSSYCNAAKVDLPDNMDVDLKNLDQLTYWLDFKYRSTDYRVISGVEIRQENEIVTLDNGMLEVEIDGGEIIRSADIDDYIIIQINAETGKVQYLMMKEYDAETGKYIVDFPCIGPYMITQPMDK